MTSKGVDSAVLTPVPQKRVRDMATNITWTLHLTPEAAEKIAPDRNAWKALVVIYY